MGDDGNSCHLRTLRRPPCHRCRGAGVRWAAAGGDRRRSVAGGASAPERSPRTGCAGSVRRRDLSPGLLQLDASCRGGGGLGGIARLRSPGLRSVGAPRRASTAQQMVDAGGRHRRGRQRTVVSLQTRRLLRLGYRDRSRHAAGLGGGRHLRDLFLGGRSPDGRRDRPGSVDGCGLRLGWAHAHAGAVRHRRADRRLLRRDPRRWLHGDGAHVSRLSALRLRAGAGAGEHGHDDHPHRTCRGCASRGADRRGTTQPARLAGARPGGGGAVDPGRRASDDRRDPRAYDSNCAISFAGAVWRYESSIASAISCQSVASVSQNDSQPYGPM